MSLVRALAFVLLPLSQIPAQAMRREELLADSSSAVIMAHLNSRTETSWFVHIMRQSRRPIAASKLNELADSLAARAIVNRPSDMGVGMLTPTGFIALAGDRGLPKGTPYTGALDRLIRIYQKATDYGVRTTALAAMLGVVGRERALDYLKTVATSNDSTSWYAINVLTIDASGGRLYGPSPSPSESNQSDAILRSLYRSGQVRNPEAKRFLTEWSLQKGY